MDLSRAIVYRGFNLNGVTQYAAQTMWYGSMVESVRMGNVPGVGWTEKRSLGDGNDASDVFLGTRRVQLQGHVYGRVLAEMFDFQQELMTVLSPTASYMANPAEFGYNPLYYAVPTLDVTWLPDENGDRLRTLYVNVRPLATPSVDIIRDSTGGQPDLGAGIAWSVTLEAKDPRVYVFPDREVSLYGAGPPYNGTFNNRGDYPSPLNILLVVPANTTATYQFTGGGSNMYIDIPTSSVQQAFRYDGYLRVLTVESNGTEVLRMDLLRFVNETTHPAIQPGNSDWTFTGPGLAPGSRLFWSEAYS